MQVFKHLDGRFSSSQMPAPHTSGWHPSVADSAQPASDSSDSSSGNNNDNAGRRRRLWWPLSWLKKKLGALTNTLLSATKVLITGQGDYSGTTKAASIEWNFDGKKPKEVCC